MVVLHFLPEIYLLKKLECLSYKSRVCILLITFLKYLLIISSFFFIFCKSVGRYRSLSSKFWADLLCYCLLPYAIRHIIRLWLPIILPAIHIEYLVQLVFFGDCRMVFSYYIDYMYDIYGGCVCVYKPLYLLAMIII